MWMLLLKPTVLLAMALGLSVLANIGLWNLHSRDLRKIGGLEAVNADALADAKACSEGIKKLREEAIKREKRITVILKSAEVKARQAEERADRTLQARPDGPDLCQAALHLSQKKLQERGAGP